MKKRVISFITALAVIVSGLLCFNVSIAFGANSGYCGAGATIFQTGKNASFSYNTTTKTLTITGTGATKDYGVTTTNKVPWYDYKTEITKVIIGEGIETIGKANFYGCTSLTSVSLPTTLKKISGSASLPMGDDDVSATNYGAFRDCTSLQNITLPEGLTTIDAVAFRGCTSLKSITLPNSLTSLGGGAFMDCTNLTTVKYGEGLTSTGTRMFYNSGVKNVIFSSTITKIDSYSFYSTKITNIEIPEQITTIGTRAFANCSFLNTVTIHNPNITFEGVNLEGGQDPFSGSSQKIIFYGHKGSTTEAYVANHPNQNYEFVSMDPCNHDNQSKVITLQPTCTAKGEYKMICDDCGAEVSTVQISETGHNWSLVETFDNTETNGHIYTEYRCVNNGCSEEKVEIEHKAFIEGLYDYTNTATCKLPGIETFTCRVEGCGKVERKPVLTASHKVEEYKVTLQPSCTEKGSEEGVCSACGETVIRSIPELGHQNELYETIDRTTENGHIEKKYRCAVCAAESTEYEHMEWIEGFFASTSFELPTCTIPGTRRDTCTVCSSSRMVTIEPKEHEWYETSRTAPTCTAVGKIYYSCKNCNSTKSENIAATGHNYLLVEDSVVEPTCTTDGVNIYKCDICGSSRRDVIKATGHTVDELNYTIEREPDCLNEGLAKSVCKTCGLDFDITLAAYGHNYEDVCVPIEDKPGHSLATPTCTRCGNQKGAQTKHEEWIEGSFTTVIVTSGSCTVAEIKRDTCSICGESRTNTVPAPGHQYSYTGMNDNGRFTYKCSVCDNVATAVPSIVFASWNIRYANTKPNDTLLGYQFELVNDGIINAKDYSLLLKSKPKAEENNPAE